MIDVSTAAFIVGGVVVFAGAAAQRTTGMGFSLVAAPLLVVIFGARNGVSITNVLAFLLAASVLVSTWRDVWWSRAAVMLGGAVIGTGVAALTVWLLPEAELQLTVGLLVMITIALIAIRVPMPFLRGPFGGAVAGLAAGYLNGAAAATGPMVAIHSIVDRWPSAAFVATAQVFFAGTNLFSVAFKGVPPLPWPMWLALLVALALGFVVGQITHHRVSARIGRVIVLVIAALGGLVIAIRGAVALFTGM